MDPFIDLTFTMAQAANADVLVGSETLRGIFDQPDRQVGSFGETVASSDPQLTLLQSDLVRLGLAKNSALTVIPDWGKVPTNFIIKHAGDDGAGLAPCTLKRGTP